MAPHPAWQALDFPVFSPQSPEAQAPLPCADTTERLQFHFSLSCIGEGNGNPLQCSCLESPRDGGAWWAAVSGVAQSWTRLKRLSNSSSSLLCAPCYDFYYFFIPTSHLLDLLHWQVDSFTSSAPWEAPVSAYYYSFNGFGPSILGHDQAITYS